MTATIERNGGFFHLFVSGGRTAGQETCAHPLDQVVGGDIVVRDDNNTTATPGANPILRLAARS